MEASFVCHAYQSQPQCHLFTSCLFLVVPRFLLPLLPNCVVCCCRCYHTVTLSESQGGGIKKGWNGRWTRTEDMMSIYSHEYRFSPGWETHAFICHSASPPDPILISPSIIYHVAFPHKHLYMHCKELPNTDWEQFMLIHLSAVLSAHGLRIWLAGICTMLFQFFWISLKKTSGQY